VRCGKLLDKVDWVAHPLVTRFTRCHIKFPRYSADVPQASTRRLCRNPIKSRMRRNQSAMRVASSSGHCPRPKWPARGTRGRRPQTAPVFLCTIDNHGDKLAHDRCIKASQSSHSGLILLAI
jgi:hypothetical protein